MPADPRHDISDILDGLRTGRLRESSAAAMIEQRLTARRRVVAHADPATRSRVLKAVYDALAGDGTDEYSALFDPGHPLGPELGHDEYTSTLVYDAPDQKGKRPAPRASYAAAPLSDDEVFDRLFGPLGQGGEGAG